MLFEHIDTNMTLFKLMVCYSMKLWSCTYHLKEFESPCSWQTFWNSVVKKAPWKRSQKVELLLPSQKTVHIFLRSKEMHVRINLIQHAPSNHIFIVKIYYKHQISIHVSITYIDDVFTMDIFEKLGDSNSTIARYSPAII